ncbi:MAG: hypothetical protein QXK18_03900 [Candidatus Bathyarchaeia archaeon]
MSHAWVNPPSLQQAFWNACHSVGSVGMDFPSGIQEGSLVKTFIAKIGLKPF